jgi:hypothetical protein
MKKRSIALALIILGVTGPVWGMKKVLISTTEELEGSLELGKPIIFNKVEEFELFDGKKSIEKTPLYKFLLEEVEETVTPITHWKLTREWQEVTKSSLKNAWKNIKQGDSTKIQEKRRSLDVYTHVSNIKEVVSKLSLDEKEKILLSKEDIEKLGITLKVIKGYKFVEHVSDTSQTPSDPSFLTMGRVIKK